MSYVGLYKILKLYHKSEFLGNPIIQIYDIASQIYKIQNRIYQHVIYTCYSLYRLKKSLWAEFCHSGHYRPILWTSIFEHFFSFFYVFCQKFLICGFRPNRPDIWWPKSNSANHLLFKKIKNLAVRQKMAEISSFLKMSSGGKTV